MPLRNRGIRSNEIVAAGINTLSPSSEQCSPHFFSVGGRCERRAPICSGKKYHRLLVRSNEIESASGTPLSVWCLGRLCP